MSEIGIRLVLHLLQILSGVRHLGEVGPDLVVRRSQQIEDEFQLLQFCFAGKNRSTSEKLAENTTHSPVRSNRGEEEEELRERMKMDKRNENEPHIRGGMIGLTAEENLWRAIPEEQEKKTE
jgi:hypothetical protein